MRYLSLFSGMEAAGLAWKPLGWQSNRTITPLRDTDGASRMTTDTTREGAGVPGLLEMSELLRARGVDVCNWAEQAVAEAAWKAAKADELAFLVSLLDYVEDATSASKLILNRIAELRGHRPVPLKGESNVQ